jgi:hypothetical protein
MGPSIINLLSCQDKYVVRLDSPRYCLEIRNYHKKRQKQYSVYGLCIISISEYHRGTINSDQIVGLARNWTWGTYDWQRAWINFPYNYKLMSHHDLLQEELESFIKKMLALFVRQYDR